MLHGVRVGRPRTLVAPSLFLCRSYGAAFNMEMELRFPSCVPVAASIVGVTWEILVLKRPGTFCGSYEGDPLSPPEGEAAQGGKPP